jgi:hypothetical protein
VKYFACAKCEIFALRANVKEKIGQSRGFDRFYFIIAFCESKKLH